MLYKFVFILIFIFEFSMSQAQENADVYWIRFTDKNQNLYDIFSPEDFLSPASLQRREKQNISIDSLDLPVSQFYLDSLENANIFVRYSSKWLNGAAIQTNQPGLIDTLENLSFIDTIFQIRERISPQPFSTKAVKESLFNYGQSDNQISMLNGDILHNQGYSGQNMIIAVLDSGFELVPSLSTFQSMISEGRIIETKDFVDGDSDVFGHHNHGRAVLSIIGGKQQGALVGSAPDANYLLIRTEDHESEQLIEEYNWVAGAEYADSIGADLINVSLGYTEYDNPNWSYSNSDIDGKTASISIAATIAARKGMLVVVAAGNNGDDENPRIGVPADADSIITVGATDANGLYAEFSSIGNTADDRIKPDVVAQGKDTYFQNDAGEITTGNGTSFSTPIIAGLAACLWQANPDKNNIQIIQAIRESASIFDNPNEYLGYGIPDFAAANLILDKLSYHNFDEENLVNLYPNPAKQYIIVDFYSVDSQNVKIEILNLQGQVLFKDSQNFKRTELKHLKINRISELAAGYYILRISTKTSIHSGKFVKQ
jgi:serine protease AprX